MNTEKVSTFLNKLKRIIVVIIIVFAIGVAVGYYFGYDIGFEKAARIFAN